MKVWDKVCGGAKKIVVFLFIELVKDIRSVIFDLISQDQLKALVETVSKLLVYLVCTQHICNLLQVKDLDGVIVNKAIKSWHSNNSEVEYTH